MVSYAYMCCVCVFSFRRESPDMILGDKPLIYEVVLSHPWEAMPEVQEHPRSTQKMSKAAPLAGSAGGPGAPTIHAINVDGGPPS
jgi:hypothetical protein